MKTRKATPVIYPSMKRDPLMEEIELVRANELDPNKKYLIEVDYRSYTMEDAHQLAVLLKKIHVDVVVTINKGDGERIVVNELPSHPYDQPLDNDHWDELVDSTQRTMEES